MLAPISRRTVFVVGFLLGLAIWLVPATFLGQSEPWDGNGPWYSLALLLGGLLLGYLGSAHSFAAVAGIFAGQLVVLLGRVISSPENSELWLVGVVFLAGYTFVATGLGAVLGTVLRRRLAPAPRGEDRRSGDRMSF
jgi:hypothetical protein